MLEWFDFVEVVAVPIVGIGLYGLHKMSQWQQTQKSITGREGLIGTRGVVKRSLKPYGRRFKGKVVVMGEWWDAVSDNPIRVDTPIVVEAVEGFVLFVKEKYE